MSIPTHIWDVTEVKEVIVCEEVAKLQCRKYYVTSKNHAFKYLLQ